MSAILTLNQLKLGDRAVIQSFQAGSEAYRQKLLIMGLTPGTNFSIKRIAPLGCPIELEVRGSSLIVRKTEAAVICVQRQS